MMCKDDKCKCNEDAIYGSLESKSGEYQTMTDARQFETGALRNSEDGKLDIEGFISPLVVERYSQYLHKHRKLADGKLRASDNWQLGIPKDVYMKSAMRHMLDVWKNHRGYATEEEFEDAVCGVLFNMNGYLFELLKSEQQDAPWGSEKA